jgi:hypothetical protein
MNTSALDIFGDLTESILVFISFVLFISDAAGLVPGALEGSGLEQQEPNISRGPTTQAVAAAPRPKPFSVSIRPWQHLSWPEFFIYYKKYFL